MTDLVKELDECAKRQLSCAPSYIPKSLEYLAAREIEAQRTRIAILSEQVISGFYEEEIPLFTQGEPTHELQDVVTADEVTRYVMKIVSLTKELEGVKAAVDNWLKDNSEKIAELERWKQALDDEAVVTFTLSGQNKDDPRKMLMDIINWHVAVALDPKVNGGYSLVKVDQPEESDDGKGTQDF
jgi:hypothetical protein